ELDRLALANALHDRLLSGDGARVARKAACRRTRRRGGAAVGEQLVEGQSQLADDVVEGAHRGAGAAGLDLGQGARRDPELAGQLAETEALALTLLTEPAAYVIVR